ncbi:hypothetical protein LX36DRAFT_701186 [Colletotrichum falcatum]|nr:hypothetical protein LX36DRAFT_701186 [Colletotrichum falcatum]
MVSRYELDPSGDVVLEFWIPNKPFAPWTPVQHTWPGLKEETSCCSFHFHDMDPARKLGDCDPVAGDSYDVPDVEEAMESPATTQTNIDLSALAASPTTNAWGNLAAIQDEAPESGPAARFLLSLKHLVLASPYFKTTMGGIWLKTRGKSSPERTTPLRGFDVDATLILMQVIHGRLHETPAAVTLELFTKVAV